MSSVASLDQVRKSRMSPQAASAQAIAQITGYEDEATLAWDKAVLSAYARLTSTPHGDLAAAEPSRLARGLELARSGAVDIEGDMITVTGASGVYTWSHPHGRCPCSDAVRYSSIRCKHMLSHAIAHEALKGTDEPLSLDIDPEVLPAPVVAEPEALAVPPCPEAVFSLNVRLQIGAHEGQITVRAMTIESFTANIQAVKALLEALESPPAPPVQAQPEAEQHYCAQHGAMKPSTKKVGTWFCSAKLSDGTYCKARWPQQ